MRTSAPWLMSGRASAAISAVPRMTPALSRTADVQFSACAKEAKKSVATATSRESLNLIGCDLLHPVYRESVLAGVGVASQIISPQRSKVPLYPKAFA